MKNPLSQNSTLNCGKFSRNNTRILGTRIWSTITFQKKLYCQKVVFQLFQVFEQWYSPTDIKKQPHSDTHCQFSIKIVISKSCIPHLRVRRTFRAEWLSLSHTHTHTHTRTRTLSLSLFLFLSLSFSHPCPFLRPHLQSPVAHRHTYTRTHTLSLSFLSSLFLSLSLSFLRPHLQSRVALTHTYTRTHTLSLSLFFSFFLFLSLSFLRQHLQSPVALSHTHTHTCTHSVFSSLFFSLFSLSFSFSLSPHLQVYSRGPRIPLSLRQISSERFIYTRVYKRHVRWEGRSCSWALLSLSRTQDESSKCHELNLQCVAVGRTLRAEVLAFHSASDKYHLELKMSRLNVTNSTCSVLHSAAP